MSFAQNDRTVPTAPLSLFEKLGELIVVGLVAMATDHGGRRTKWTGGAGNPISGRLSGSPKEDGKRTCGANSAPRAEEVIGDASGSAPKGAARVVSDCGEMYYP